MQDKPVYLTQEGKDRFAEELRELVDEKRPEIAQRIQKAIELGDVNDNPELADAREELSFVEGRIHELERLLATAELINEAPKSDHVRLGSYVTVTTGEGEEDTYHLVGSNEADPRHGLVSNESPIGRALLGKRIGETTTVVAPGGSFTLTVKKIEARGKPSQRSG